MRYIDRYRCPPFRGRPGRKGRLMRIRKDNELQDEELDFIASVSDALAHPVRLRLFRYVMTANRQMETVCNRDLVEVSGYAQATISQHMRKLLVSGLVEGRKKESYTYYYVNLGVLGRYLNSVKKLNSPV